MDILIITISLILLAVFLFKPKIGLYLTAFFLPVIGFDLNLASFRIPPVDLVALILLISFLLKHLFNFFFEPEKKIKLRFPLLFPFALFLTISFISSLLSTDPIYSIWYFCRWPLFLYLAYILVPYNLIKDRKTLKNLIITTTFSAMIVLIFGLLSLFGQDISDSFFRVRLISIFNLYPFGDNHNLIAEFLNIGTFFLLALRVLAKTDKLKRIIDILFLASFITIILTFSRTGWIVLAFQTFAYIWLYLKEKKINKKRLLVPIILSILILSPFFFKMGNLQSDNTSSTENRWILTEISFKAFKEKPLLGEGSGFFIRLVERDIRFRAKYGDPIDSHGILQKVLAENGLLGLLSWLFILIVLFKEYYQAFIKYNKKAPWLAPLILGSFGGLLFQFLNTSYYKGKVWLPIVVTLLAIELLNNNKKKGINK